MPLFMSEFILSKSEFMFQAVCVLTEQVRFMKVIAVCYDMLAIIIAIGGGKKCTHQRCKA